MDQDDKFMTNISKFRIKYIESNVIIIGNQRIPIYVKFIASLGPNFSYATKVNEIDKLEIMKCLNNIGDMIGDYEAWKVFSNFKLNVEAETKFTEAQNFIKFQFYRTRKFLRDNSNIIITLADKGGKVVITEKDIYKQKMNEFVNGCIEKRIFHKVNLSFEDRRSYVESKYENLIRNINPYLEDDAQKGYLHCCYQLSHEPFIIARLYGLFKIHKEDIPIRPIISNSNCMGQNLIEWLLSKLAIITSHISKFKTKNSITVFNKLNGKTLNECSTLSTSDFDSMYTNINFGKTKNIIRKYYHLIAIQTNVPIETFLEALSFFIMDDAYFTFNNTIYRQCKGLSMGNALSGILAEIYLSESLNEIVEGIPPGILDFMFIFVDDIFYGVQEEYKRILISRIIEATNINLKSTEEDGNNSVNYLNMECIRNETNNKLEFRWWQKPESAKRILDFHSFHPLQMKINIISEFVMNALRVTSKHFWNETILSVDNVLSNSNYPVRIRKTIFSKSCKQLGTIEVTSSTGDVHVDAIAMYNLMVPPTHLRNSNIKTIQDSKLKTIRANKQKRTHVAIPYHPNLKSSIRSLTEQLNITNLSLASRMIIKNHTHIYSNTKDERNLSGIRNAWFMIKCQHCSFEWGCKTNNLDIGRTESHHMNNKLSPPYLHINENGSHKLFIDESTIIRFKNKKELGLFIG